MGINAYTIATESDQTKEYSHPHPIIYSISDTFKEFAPDRETHSILCALTLGIKDNIPQNIKNDYSNAGVMHILALSGLHIGIIYMIVCALLAPLNINHKLKRYKILISLCIICIYAYLTGGSPSITRAAITICIWGINTLFNKRANKWNNLAVSAFIIGIIDPKGVTQVGCQLSYAAIIGIIGLFPTVEQSEKQIMAKIHCTPVLQHILKRTMDIIGISVCCQITTLPLTLFYFGSSAQYFLIGNIVAIPLATIILYLLIFTAVTLPVPFVGTMAGKILNYTINIMNSLINFISN